MADESASLIMKVSAEGAPAASKALDDVSQSADKAVASSKELRKEQEEAERASNRMRYAIGNAANQVQDFVVEVQGGINPLKAMNQQLPQLLGAFGPMGAVAGTVFALASALGSTLYNAITNTKDNSKELKEASKELDTVFDTEAYGAAELSDKFMTLAANSKEAARAMLELEQRKIAQLLDDTNGKARDVAATFNDTFTTSIKTAVEEVTRFRAEGKDAFDVLKDAPTHSVAAVSGLADLDNVVRSVATSFGVTRDQAMDFTRQLVRVQETPTATTIQQLNDKMQELHGSVGPNNVAFEEMWTKVQKLNEVYAKLGAQSTEARKAIDDMTGTFRAQQYAAEGDAKYLESLRESVLKGGDLYKMRKEAALKDLADRKGLSDQEREEARRDIELRAKQQTDEYNARQEKHVAAADKHVETERMQYERLDEQLKAHTGTALQQIDEENRQKQAKFKEGYDKGILDNETYQKYLTDLNEQYKTRRQVELDKELKENQAAESKHYSDLGRQSREFHQFEERKIKQHNDNMKALNSNIGETFGAMADAMEAAGKKSSALYKAMFLGQKAAAIASIIMDTNAAAEKAMGQTGLLGFSMASEIEAMGAIRAGIVAGTTFAGLFDEGGYIPAGKKGIVGENGPELVEGPLNVTSRRDTAALAASAVNGGNSGAMNVTIVQHVNGSGDAALAKATGQAVQQAVATIQRDFSSNGPTRRLLGR